MERDAHAQESRDRETRILSLTNELDTLKSSMDETDRIKRMLQLELDESVRDSCIILLFSLINPL